MVLARIVEPPPSSFHQIDSRFSPPTHHIMTRQGHASGSFLAIYLASHPSTGFLRRFLPPPLGRTSQCSLVMVLPLSASSPTGTQGVPSATPLPPSGTPVVQQPRVNSWKASSGGANPMPMERKKDQDGYIPMNWLEDGGRKTRDLLQHIKDDPVLRQSLYPGQGEDTTPMTATKCHQLLAEHLLKDDERYSNVWPRLKCKYGQAVKCRLHKLYEGYVHKRAILNSSGAGLSDADRAKFPDVNNLPELVRKLFVWYDAMDEFCHERAVVGLDSLMNSDDSPDIGILGVTRRAQDGAAKAGPKKQRVAMEQGDGDEPDIDEGGEVLVVKDGSQSSPPGQDDAKDENIQRTRGTRSGLVDLAPISQAIREGDALREATKKAKLASDEKKKERDLEYKLKKAKEVLEYKLQRDKLRSEVAYTKIKAEQDGIKTKAEHEIRLRELEIEAIKARVQEQEVALQLVRARADHRGADDETVASGPSSGGRAHASTLPRTSLSHLLL